ncbi:hypothetical protein, partial [Streptomyces sp. NPDC093970]|uniref:hypothetical protein n=1 Tax=Streptomyces sp. NPDC093970 TaxID=3155076 RepID=UPI003416214B
ASPTKTSQSSINGYSSLEVLRRDPQDLTVTPNTKGCPVTDLEVGFDMGDRCMNSPVIQRG